MKKNYVLSVAIALTLVACGGQSDKKTSETDSVGIAENADVVVTEPDTIEETVANEVEKVEPVLNVSLMGKWNNNEDPNISMEVSEKHGNYGGCKGYGFLNAANEAYELDFELVFTSLTPDGERIRVKYDKMESYYTGDPDDFDSEGEWVKKKVGSGELTLIPNGTNKLKLDTRESRLKDVILYKH